MNVDVPEGDAVILLIAVATGLLNRRVLLMLLHEVAAKHDHARQPEEQDVEPGDHQRVRIEHI